MKICPKCGKGCFDEAVVCPKCKFSFSGKNKKTANSQGAKGLFTKKSETIEQLTADNQRLFQDNQRLYQENQLLRKENQQLSDIKNNLSHLKDEIQFLEHEILIKSVEVNLNDFITSEEVKTKLDLLKLQEDELIKANKAVISNADNSSKTNNNNIKQILRCFNAEMSVILTNITVKNIDTMRSRIMRVFETVNKIFETDGISLSKQLLEMKLSQAVLIYTYERKKEDEREEQRAIREQMLEEEKVRREIEREKAKIEKEETQFRNEISKLMQYLQKAQDIEKQLYVNKITELEEKLKLLEKDKENVLEREQNTRAGFVYVISNIGSFGENIFKIGMTRRLEPMERIKELGDASVPFEFDVHAMIFSEDAPALESILHQTFRAREVNKINHRKEFFNVTLSEIENIVTKNHNATVTFTKVAEAEQYRQSLLIAEN